MGIEGSYDCRVVLRAEGLGNETMGTKEKFWYRDGSGASWLFKFARRNTGEHWSEKIAAEIGHMLDIPCARVDLATCDGQPGSVSMSFVETGSGSLVHGNELLQEVDETYPTVRLRGVSKHTVGAVLQRLKGVDPPRSAESSLACAADWFVGYLLLDAVIVNSDRHHENWGVLQLASGVRVLAPSYDHASSLGRELTDGERQRRLETKDPAFEPSGYVSRARSGLYAEVGAKRPLHPADAFRLAGEQHPAAMAIWLSRLRDTGFGGFERIVARVPDTMISDTSRAFTLAVLLAARQNLLDHSNSVPGSQS